MLFINRFSAFGFSVCFFASDGSNQMDAANDYDATSADDTDIHFDDSSAVISSSDSAPASFSDPSSGFTAIKSKSEKKSDPKKPAARALAGKAFQADFQARMRQDSPSYVQEFLSYMLAIKGRSVNTVEGYYRDLRVFLRFLKVYQNQASLDEFHEIFIADFPLSEIAKIRPADIYAFLNFCMRVLENGDHARARKSSCLRSFFKYLHKMNYITDDPTKDLDMPAVKKRLPKHLTLDESIAVLEHVESDFPARDFCILTFFLNCGMRVSELVGINLSSIQESTLRIVGKGNKERILYLNEACCKALAAYLDERKKIKNLEEPDALFVSRNSRRISKRRVQQIVEYNLKKNGLFGFSTHKLRHTAATLLYQHGHVDIRVLKELLGHSVISTTEIYTHVSNEQVKDAIFKSPLQGATQKPKKKSGKQDESKGN